MIRQKTQGINGTCTFASPTAAHSLILVLFDYISVSTVTDDKGNSYQTNVDGTGQNGPGPGFVQEVGTGWLPSANIGGWHPVAGISTIQVDSGRSGVNVWAFEVVPLHPLTHAGFDSDDGTNGSGTVLLDKNWPWLFQNDDGSGDPTPWTDDYFTIVNGDGGNLASVDSGWTFYSRQGNSAVAYKEGSQGEVLGGTQGCEGVTFSPAQGGWAAAGFSVRVAAPIVATPGKIIVSKVTEPAGSTQSFSFTTNYGPSFALQDGETNDSGDLTPGTYSVSEAPVAGWTSLTNIDPSAVVVGSGETVRLIFTNTNVVGGTGGSGPLFGGGVQPWLVSIEDQQLTVNDLDGGADLADLVFTVQDRRNLITADFPGFVFEGKGMRLLAGFEGMKRSDFVTLFTGRVDSVESTNSNLEYIFTCPDVRTELSRVIYTVADDGFATSSDHVRTLNGHPLDILLHALEDELGLTGQIDTATIIQYRDTIGSGWQMTFTLDSPPVAKDFLENEIMKPLGAYLFSNNLGLISVNFFYPFSTTPVFAFSPDNLTEIPEAGQTGLINQVSSRFDSNGSDFKQESITEEPASVAKYGLYGSQIIESKGLRSGFNGFFLSRLTAFLIFLRYGFKALCHGDNGKNSSSNPVNALWNACTLEPGDLVSMTHPQIPNRATGTLGIVDQTYLVMDRTWQFFQGNVQYKLLAVDLSKFKHYLITPNGEASYTSAGATDQGKYMFLCNDSDTYSNGAPGNTLG